MAHRMPGLKIEAQETVCENARGEITILYKGRALDYSIFHRQRRQAEVVLSKEIDTHHKKSKKPYKLAPNHPWRQYGRQIKSRSNPETTN